MDRKLSVKDLVGHWSICSYLLCCDVWSRNDGNNTYIFTISTYFRDCS